MKSSSPPDRAGARAPASAGDSAEATIVEKNKRVSQALPAVADADDDLDEATPGPELAFDLGDMPGDVFAPGGTVVDRGSHPSQAGSPSERSGARSMNVGSGSTQHGVSTVTPDVALRSEELLRTRLFLHVAALLAIVTGCTFFVVPRTAMPVWVPVSGSVLVFTSCLWFSWILRDEAKFTTERLVVVAYIATLAATTCILYYGMFSPAPAVYTFGLYFFSLGASRRGVTAIYLTAASLHGIPSILYIAGAVPDPGLIRADELPRHVQVIVLGLVQLIFALTFLLARGSRRATVTAIERLHQAIIQVQKRDALLAEAHQDLDRALKAGYHGRHTGQRIGPYQLEEVIGRGAMGEVYRGAHVDTAEPAAVKLLHPDVLAEPAHVRRFFREAEIVSKLRSPHVVRVLSLGTMDPTRTDRELPYIAMELLEGRDLAFHLRKKRRLSTRRVVELVDQVAHALEAAAGADVVHRDLKPQNIFLARDAQDPRAPRVWKVLDFGVSKLASAHGTLTQGAVIGTPGYMAPEQARGGDVDPSADVFALATIAYRALTGRPAFSGSDLPRVLFDVCYTQPARPGALAPLTEDIERVLAIGMAKEPRDRFQTARQLAAALEAACSDHGLPPDLKQRADKLLAKMPWGR